MCDVCENGMFLQGRIGAKELAFRQQTVDAFKNLVSL